MQLIPLWYCLDATIGLENRDFAWWFVEIRKIWSYELKCISPKVTWQGPDVQCDGGDGATGREVVYMESSGWRLAGISALIWSKNTGNSPCFLSPSLNLLFHLSHTPEKCQEKDMWGHTFVTFCHPRTFYNSHQARQHPCWYPGLSFQSFQLQELHFCCVSHHGIFSW